MSLENQKLHVAEVIHGADMEIHNIVLRHLPNLSEDRAWTDMGQELSALFERYPGNDDFLAPIILAHLDIVATLTDGKTQKERTAKARRWLKDVCGEK